MPELHTAPALSCLCGIFKLRLGASIPRSVGLSVGRSVCRSVGPPKITKKITKLYKNFTKHYKNFTNLPPKGDK